jgi:uncharacterized membrane protein YccC
LNILRFRMDEAHGMLPPSSTCQESILLRHIFNTVATALLAMAVAAGLGLPSPQIAMACVCIVMQPQARLVFHKSGYRMLGTVAGALAAWMLAALFSQSPASFLTAVGVWVTLFTIIAACHSKLPAYSIVLTGYTPVLIGIPMALESAHIAHGAASRLAEVAIGVACASAVAFLNGGAAERAPAPVAPTAAAQVAPPRSRLAAGATLAGLHPAIAMLLMASLWLCTSWRGGPMATLNATVDCALVALAARPLRMALQMSAGTLLAVAAGLALQGCYPLLPLTPWLLFAPALALGAWMTGRSASLGQGLGYSITLCMLAYPATGADQQYLHDAAGLALSVCVLTAICALLLPLRPRPTTV